MRSLVILSTLLLAGCASDFQVMNSGPIENLHCPAACDSKWCWPAFTLTRPSTLSYDSNLKRFGDIGALTFMHNVPGATCRMFMPSYKPTRGWKNLLCHEAWHCQSGLSHGDEFEKTWRTRYEQAQSSH